MHKSNQKQHSIEISTNATFVELFQSIPDEQAETVKGGYVRWNSGGHSLGLEHYCFKTYQLKQSYFSK